MTTDSGRILQQSSTQPPAQPSYILRGHSAQIHTVHFLRQNTRLLTGDAEGWVILWDVALRRPSAVWRAHTTTVLGLTDWIDEKVITHGRDGKLCVWQIREEDESGLSTTLPVDDGEADRKLPWLLHSLTVHTLNFCSFAICRMPEHRPLGGADNGHDDILVAVSGVQDGSIIVMSLPSERRIATISPPRDVKTGMLMAIGLHDLGNKKDFAVLAGYESGHAAVWTQMPGASNWQPVYIQKAHSQPIMSLGIAHTLEAFFTSSADAVLARHSIRDGSLEMFTSQTKHAGQQSLQVRSDEKILATAGWDGRVRVYSTKTMKELAVLKWHKEGCYAVAYAQLDIQLESGGKHSKTNEVARRTMTMSERRIAAAKTTHWLAAGSKDGKISLWEIY